MASRSKDLLELEHKKPSVSPIESTLLVCKTGSVPKKSQPDDDAKRVTAPLPKSQLLGTVRNFLGVMSEANEKLQLDAKDNPEKYDIEALTGNESHVINMECILGLVDLQTPESVAAAEAAISGHQPVVPVAISSGGEESDESSEDDSTSDDEGENCDEDSKTSSPVNLKTFKPHKTSSSSREASNKRPKKRPKIVMLS